MKSKRRAKILRGPLNAAPVAGVMLLLVIFVLLSSLLYTPGVLIELPSSSALTVTDNPVVVVEVDSGGQCFYENKLVDAAELKAALKSRLRSTALQSRKLTLLLRADKSTRNEDIMRLETLAQTTGITQVLIAARPVAFGPQQ